MDVSCSCSADVRHTELAHVFIALICDQSRWVSGLRRYYFIIIFFIAKIALDLEKPRKALNSVISKVYEPGNAELDLELD